MDNYSSQNKSWVVFSFLVYIINHHGISAETITLKYFETGHTFMSADSYHHQVNDSLKKPKKVYDFKDFVHAFEMYNKRNGMLEKCQLKISNSRRIDFLYLKLKKETKLYISKISEIVKRNEYDFYFKINAKFDWRKLDFLHKQILIYFKYISNMSDPLITPQPNEFKKGK